MTLWDLLMQPSLTLHLPRFALFLTIAVMLEWVVSGKRVCLYCTVPTVMLLLLTGLGGILAITLMVSSHIYVGSRVRMPFWYYPIAFALLITAWAFFLKGARMVLKERLLVNGGIRCLVFAVTLFFYCSTVTTPIKVNASIQQWEKTESSP